MSTDCFSDAMDGLDEYWMSFDENREVVERAWAEIGDLRAVADAARTVAEEAATIVWRYGRDGTITNETGRKAWRTMTTALDKRDKIEKEKP